MDERGTTKQYCFVQFLYFFLSIKYIIDFREGIFIPCNSSNNKYIIWTKTAYYNFLLVH